MTETRIIRPRNSIYFCSYTDSQLCNMPKDWRPPITDYAEPKPTSLYLVFPSGAVFEYETETAVNNETLCLPDCRIAFTENSPCVKSLFRDCKYKVAIHKETCYLYTPVKFKALLLKAGQKSLKKQLDYIKDKLNEYYSKKRLTQTLTDQFSRGL